MLENLVAISLFHHHGERLYYYNYGVEVDFYIPDEQLGIQVSYSIADTQTCNREITALLKLNAYKPLKRMLVITYNEENTLIKEGHTIEIVPVWKWLVELDS